MYYLNCVSVVTQELVQWKFKIIKHVFHFKTLEQTSIAAYFIEAAF